MSRVDRREGRIRTTLFPFIVLGVSLLLGTPSLCSAQDSETALANEFKEAREAEGQGKYLEAVGHYQHILSLDPKLAEAYTNLGIDYYRLNRYAEAAASLEKALAIQPGVVGAEVFLGLAEFRLGQFKDSLGHLQPALKAQPNNREVCLFLIQDQTALGQFDRRFVEQTLGFFPTDPELNYVIGLAALERIRSIAQHANSLGRQSPLYHWIYLQQDEEKQDALNAEKHRQALKELGATTPPPEVQEYEELTALVKKCFATVLQSSPDSSYAHSVQGNIDESQNLIDAALTEYRKAGDHFAAGRLLAQNSRLPEATEEFEAAVRVEPENHLALAELAQVYVQQHQPERALPLLQKLLTYYPQDALAWADLGKAQINLGNTQEGIHSLQTSLKIDASQTKLHYELAMAYRTLGKSDLAKQELDEFSRRSLAEHHK